LKVTQVILILKPGKPSNELTSYRPISLLLILPKICETFLLKRLLKVIENNVFISDHQFCFRERHSTAGKIHRIVQKINEAPEN
jgi:hypothetical protein